MLEGWNYEQWLCQHDDLKVRPVRGWESLRSRQRSRKPEWATSFEPRSWTVASAEAHEACFVLRVDLRERLVSAAGGDAGRSGQASRGAGVPNDNAAFRGTDVAVKGADTSCLRAEQRSWSSLLICKPYAAFDIEISRSEGVSHVPL